MKNRNYILLTWEGAKETIPIFAEKKYFIQKTLLDGIYLDNLSSLHTNFMKEI